MIDSKEDNGAAQVTPAFPPRTPLVEFSHRWWISTTRVGPFMSTINNDKFMVIDLRCSGAPGYLKLSSGRWPPFFFWPCFCSRRAVGYTRRSGPENPGYPRLTGARARSKAANSAHGLLKLPSRFIPRGNHGRPEIRSALCKQERASLRSPAFTSPTSQPESR